MSVISRPTFSEPVIWLRPNFIALSGSKLVADRFEAGRRPVTCSELKFGLSSSSELARASRSATGPGPASNLSATSFEPDSVMEFGFEPVCDQLREVRAISTCRGSSNLLEAGCRTVRSQIPLCCPGRRQVRSWFEAGRRQVRNSFEPVCDQLRTCFEPALNQLAFN